MPINFREPRWILFIVLCLAGAFYSWYFFADAFPIVDINIAMDRKSALQTANKLAKKHDLGPDDFQQSASFDHDGEVQNFVELEAGGKDAFREMMRKDLYQPYHWSVRHYAQGETRETSYYFTPDGRIYGFSEHWPEDDTGPSLTTEAARTIAEERAVEDWNVTLENYRLVSTDQNERPSGRVDHTFTYERRSADLGDGEYRLQLAVSGDQLSKVNHYVKIPEAFSRRYENMRSSNRTIQNVGNIFVYLVYLMIGCLGGSFWLIRRNALKWKTALFWGGLISVLLFLSRLNALPLAWMQYDTAMSQWNFLLQQIVQALSSTAMFGVIITISFIAAEGLTRLAFQHHPKFWKLWNPRAAGSKTVSSITVFGYVTIGLYFAYNVALYSFAHDKLDWWSPSQLLYDPNILAHYVTWLKPFVNALRAGFWEECLFRAVPLAGAALLGNRFGRRKWWIGIVLVAQALIFGAGHASYATQPSYARVVELFTSSLGMGLIYLAYGLLPVIIVHFIYDLILMSMPLFVSTAPGVWISQTIIVLIAFVPLLVVLQGYFYSGGWRDLPEEFWNSFRDTTDEPKQKASSFPVPNGLNWKRTSLILVAGITAMSVWFTYEDFTTYETPLKETKQEAKQRAKQRLEENGENPEDWMMTATVSSSNSDDDAFVWQEGGKDTYEELMGSFLYGPYWTVRFVTFEGSVTDRAEEYRVRLASGYSFEEIEHYLPESAEGDSLPEIEARAIADSAVIDNYRYKIEDLERLSSGSTKRPNRRDWDFIYRVPGDYPLEEGEARLRVSLAGSEVTDTTRYVHVPESWKRENRNREKINGLIGSFTKTILYLLVIFGALAGLVFWGRGNDFSIRACLYVFGALVGLLVLGTINEWPSILANLDTAEPYYNQIFMVLARRTTMLIFMGIYALIAGFIHGQIGQNQSASFLQSLLVGFSIASVGVAVLTVSSYLSPDLAPQWGSYSSLDRTIPWIHHTISSMRFLITGSLVLLLFAVGHHRLSFAGKRWNVLIGLGSVVFGAVVASNMGFNHVMQWALMSGGIGAIFVLVAMFVLPYDRSFIPALMSWVIVIRQVELVLRTEHGYAVPGSLLAIVVVFFFGGLWTWILQRRQVGG